MKLQSIGPLLMLLATANNRMYSCIYLIYLFACLSMHISCSNLVILRFNFSLVHDSEINNQSLVHDSEINQSLIHDSEIDSAIATELGGKKAIFSDNMPSKIILQD